MFEAVNGRLVSPKLGTELFEDLEPILDSPWTVWVVCVIIYVINYGLGVVGPKMDMDSVPQSGTDAW